MQKNTKIFWLYLRAIRIIILSILLDIFYLTWMSSMV